MKKLFKNYKLLVVYAILAMFGVSSVANAAAVTMESKHLVRNASKNEVNYVPTTTAKSGDTLRYMVWYHNTMNENSGLNATNLKVSVSLPTAVSNSHITKATVSGDNTNTVSQTTQVSTEGETKLEYVPGTASRRYNAGTNAAPSWVTVSIPDTIVNGGYVIPSMQPCWNFEESIVFSVKVVEAPKPAPTCTISATPASIEKGNSSVLTYSSTNATSGNIGGVGSVGTSGKSTVYPTATTTYTYSVGGEGGTATCQTTVTVTEKPVYPPVNPPVVPPTVITGKGNVPLPTSGPAEAAAGAAGLTATGGAAYAWMRSKKALLSALTKVK